jgi:tetratricopeptide (TPR) repeat protein
LGVSYLKHANTYFAASCYEQAIFYAELAKKHVKDPLLNEEAAFIILNCLLRLDRVDEAHDLLKTISISVDI